VLGGVPPARCGARFSPGGLARVDTRGAFTWALELTVERMGWQLIAFWRLAKTKHSLARIDLKEH